MTMDGDNITNMMSFLFVSIIATETYILHNHSIRVKNKKIVDSVKTLG